MFLAYATFEHALSVEVGHDLQVSASLYLFIYNTKCKINVTSSVAIHQTAG